MLLSAMIIATIVPALSGTTAFAAESLGSYNVDPAGVTVAGISSGAFMAVQLNVAFSSQFHGLAVFAGGPYDCAQDIVAEAEGPCGSGVGVSVPALVTYTNNQTSLDTIDATSHLQGEPVYLFSGTLDTIVHQAVMDELQQYLETYVSSSEITYDNSTLAEHSWISPDGPNACGVLASPFINNCAMDPEQTFLTKFYGTLHARNGGALGGTLIQFDQNAFCSGGSCSDISMDSTGWVFVPADCASGATCRIVLAIHGCGQGQSAVGEDFVKLSGLNEWADTNDIIVLYPQAIASTANPSNPEGCWDWWGYTNSNYALRSGAQPQALLAMVHQLEGGFPDAGHPTSSTDAGEPTDAGSPALLDAGTAGDAGQPQQDAGPLEDAGTQGTATDAGNGGPTAIDAGAASEGSDAGSASAGGSPSQPRQGCGCGSSTDGEALFFLMTLLARKRIRTSFRAFVQRHTVR